MNDCAQYDHNLIWVWQSDGTLVRQCSRCFEVRDWYASASTFNKFIANRNQWVAIPVRCDEDVRGR